MSRIEQLLCDKRLSSSTRLVAVEILRKIDPLTGRARITAEQLADTLDIAVGTVRKATTILTGSARAILIPGRWPLQRYRLLLPNRS
jgi:hypothetical protein